MSARAIPAPVLTRQAQASDPQVSAFVSANAGAGKTHVLAQRVIRLLLAGTDPMKILCITFTKAAAANMAARVRAAAVRLRARHAGRAQGADDPRVLHPAAASVPVRGQRAGALRGARR